MRVEIASSAGFCFGVQRAVDRVYDLIREGRKPIYTLGPIIHNETVVQDLERQGVKAIEEDQLEGLKEGIVVIRSHGVSRAVYEKLDKLGLEYVDVTCPFVRKIHHIVEKESALGREILIAGDPLHPEVIGIRGWCSKESSVLSSIPEAEAFSLPSGKEICVVSQTTFNYNKFQDMVEILKKKSYDIDVLSVPGSLRILNTICNATEERQSQARQIAAAVDTMLVVGGRTSSNTQKLFDICKRECKNTYYIQTPVDLDSDMFQRSSYVGITAGASTPKKIIEEVARHVRENF